MLEIYYECQELVLTKLNETFASFSLFCYKNGPLTHEHFKEKVPPPWIKIPLFHVLCSAAGINIVLTIDPWSRTAQHDGDFFTNYCPCVHNYPTHRCQNAFSVFLGGYEVFGGASANSRDVFLTKKEETALSCFGSVLGANSGSSGQTFHHFRKRALHVCADGQAQ